MSKILIEYLTELYAGCPEDWWMCMYVPTANKSEQTVEEFYEPINGLLKSIKKSVWIIMDDFNSKIDSSK